MAQYGKSDVVDNIASKAGISKSQATAAFDAFADLVKGLKAEGDKVVIPGFVKFEVRNIPAKSGVSKLGGVEKKWSTPAHKAVKAKVTFK